MAIQFCPHCAEPIDAGARFCSSCGNELSGSPSMPAAKPRRTRRRWLWLLVVTVAAYAAYSAAAVRAFDGAASAHRSGDCEPAASGYERINGFYRLAATVRRDEARRRARECREALEAERLTSDGAYLHAADAFASLRLEFADSPIRERHEQREAEVLLTLGGERSAAAESGSDFVHAIEPFERVLKELGWRANEADKARRAIETIWATASDVSDPCRRRDNLEALAAASFSQPETQPLTKEACYTVASTSAGSRSGSGSPRPTRSTISR